jgi:hypothetical protein
MKEMVDAVNKHIELYNLGSIFSDVLMCIQTDSEKAEKDLFGKAEAVHQGAIVTPRWLLWVVMDSSNKAAVLSAQLSDVGVQDYAQTQFAKMIPDSGIQVNGKFTEVSENASAFIGLDDGEVGRRFKESVIMAVQNSKK